MTKKLKFIGAALVALAILPAAVLLFHASLSHVLMGLLIDSRYDGDVPVVPGTRQFWRQLHRGDHGANTGTVRASAGGGGASGDVGHRNHGGDYAQSGDLDGGPGGATAVHPVLLVDAGHDCAVDLIRVDERERGDDQQDHDHHGHWRHVHGHYSAALLGQPIGGDLWPWLSGK